MNQHEDSRLGETAKGVAGSPLVALSFGSFGDDSDLTLLGYHVHHVHLAVLQVARALLDAGCSIGYGGIFHHEDSFLRQLLLLVSRFESEANRLGLEDQGKRHPSSRFAPLVSYQAWPHHRAIDTQTIASNHRLCRFIKVDPEEFYKVDAAGLSGEAMRARADDDLVAAAFLQAQALSRMRRVMIEGVADTVDGITCTDGEVPVAHGRVVFGGKSSRTSGIMPGIAEEVLVSLRALEPGTPICHAGPLLIVGEFGGCAKVIADYLTGASGNSENLPASLDLATVRNNDAAFQRVESGFLAYHPLASAYLENEWSDLAVRLQTLRRRVREEGLVHELKEKEAPVAGLTIEISKGGHLIVHPPSVRRLVARLLATLSGRSTS